MNIVWFVSSLEQKGGGERFVLEAVNALRLSGHKVTIVCERLNQLASFDGKYDLSLVRFTNMNYKTNGSYLRRVYQKFIGMFSLYRELREIKPDMVFCQSEFDAIKIWCISKILSFKYRTFIFGQMFQFKTDITKYSRTFRKSLVPILNSRPGYRETVIMPPPKLSHIVWLVNEIISIIKKKAIRGSDKIFTLSNQVGWEVELLYESKSEVCRAAFNQDYIDKARLYSPKKIGSQIRLLSVSRLVDKKRVDLIIQAFAEAKVAAILVIVGVGPEEKNLKSLAHKLGCSDSIEFLGSISDLELKEQLDKSDCFISMDVGDYDISVVEAMGKALRVIVPKDFDLTAFGHGFTGVSLVDSNLYALSRAIESLATMPPPSAINLDALNRLTWQHLAIHCTSD